MSALVDSSTETEVAHAFVTEGARAAAIVCHEFCRRDDLGNEAIYLNMVRPLRSRRVLPVLGTKRALTFD